MELVTLAKNPVPSGAIVGTFKSSSRLKLRFARWEATRGPARGTMCVFQGRSESIEKYFEVVADLRRRGFAVATMDWQGQGGSDRLLSNPRKGHVRSFADFDRDLAAFMTEIVRPSCRPPYFALAHSMGGNILLRNAAEPSSWFERIVLSAPMIEIAEAQLKPSAGLGARIRRGLGRRGARMALCLRRHRRVGKVRAVPEQSPNHRCRALCAQSHDHRDGARAGARIADHRLAEGGLEVHRQGIGARLPHEGQGPHAAVCSRDGHHRLDHGHRGVRAAAEGRHPSVLLSHARHEILQETDPVRKDFWAAFDAYMGVDAPVA